MSLSIEYIGKLGKINDDFVNFSQIFTIIRDFSLVSKYICLERTLNRTWYGKKEIQVYDYVDDKVPVLFRMYGRRLKGYKSLGFMVK
jgi:hypothetical protein